MRSNKAPTSYPLKSKTSINREEIQPPSTSKKAGISNSRSKSQKSAMPVEPAIREWLESSTERKIRMEKCLLTLARVELQIEIHPNQFHRSKKIHK